MPETNRNLLNIHLEQAAAEAKRISRILLNDGWEAVLEVIAPDQIEPFRVNKWRAGNARPKADLAIVQSLRFVELHTEENCQVCQLIRNFDRVLHSVVNAPVWWAGPGIRGGGDIHAPRRFANELAQHLLALVAEAEEILDRRVGANTRTSPPAWSAPMSKVEIVRRWYNRYETQPQRFFDEILTDDAKKQLSKNRWVVDLNAVPAEKLERFMADRNWIPGES